MQRQLYLSDRNGELSDTVTMSWKYYLKKGFTMSDRYFVDRQSIHRNGKEGVDQLTNFAPRIKKELVYHDGSKQATHLVIDGMIRDDEVDDATGEPKFPEGKPLPEITVPATDFAGLGWVAEQWGMSPIIYPHSGAERDLRTAIQVASKPDREHIYTHTGWINIKGKPYYMTMSGGINEKGLDKTLKVELPTELTRYLLPEPEDNRDAFLDSLRLVNIGDQGGETMTTLWPLLLSTYRAAVGPADFGLHLAGRTGTFKSEVSSLFQSHYGAGMDARHLPASWSSTGNAIEHLAYTAKNALMVLDDYVPTGTAYHVRSLQKTADQIFRGQGNQAGRSRLTDISKMQVTYYPRGIVLSTGEDVPEGHSMRGRMLIMELMPGSIDKTKLSQAQAKREQYSKAMADWVKWLAATNSAEALNKEAGQIRDKNLEVGHSRTPATIGQLLATLNLLRRYAVEDKQWLRPEVWDTVQKSAEAAVMKAANNQTSFLEAADPVQAALDTIRLLLGAGMAHVKTKNGGIPEDAEKYGWKKEQAAGEMASYRMQGPRIGWIDPDKGEFYLDANCITLLKKHSGGKIAITAQTLQKRMKESGIISRCDDQRQRNTIRVSCEGHQRQVLCMHIDDVFDEGE